MHTLQDRDDTPPVLSPHYRATLLALSDERDHWEARLLEAERAGFDRGQQSMAGEFTRGVVAGLALVKRAQHGVVDDLRAHHRMWDGPRQRFGQPRPGDLTGTELVARARASWGGGA